MEDRDAPPMDGGARVSARHHRCHDHHGGKYAWSGAEADSYLQRARRGARRAYAPMVALVRDSLPEGDSSPTVLDVGCGPGLLLMELRRALPSAHLIGVDPSVNMLAVARKVASESEAGDGAPAFEVREGSGEALPADDESVDVVTCRRVLHEFDDVEAALREIARVLRPGSALVLQDFDGACPRWKLWLMAGIACVFRGRDAAERITRPFEDALALEEVIGLCDGAGLKVVRADRGGPHLTLVGRRPGA